MTTVTMKAQGIIREVEFDKFHADTQAAIITYGTRRWFQDHMNSVAKSLRDEGSEVNAEELFDARLAQALSGDITVRGSAVSTDPLDKYRILVLREHMRQNPDGELKATYDAIGSDDQKARREYLLSVAAKNEALVDKEAKALKAIDDKRAASAESLDIAI